jgi:excisionase family DNA binding protein
MTQQATVPAELRPLLVSPLQAAAMLGVGRTTIYYLTRNGALHAIRIGRSTRYAVRDLEEYVRVQAGQVTADHDASEPK